MRKMYLKILVSRINKESSRFDGMLEFYWDNITFYQCEMSLLKKLNQIYSF